MPTKAEFTGRWRTQVSTQLSGQPEGMAGLSHYCFPPLQVPVP